MNHKFKLTFALACAILALGLSGCKSSNNSDVVPTYTPYITDQFPMETPYPTATPVISQTIPPNAANTSVIPETATAGDVVSQIKKGVDISNIKDKDGTAVGAVKAGKSFTYNGKTFELYKFTDASLLSEAKTGSMTFDMDGNTKTMNSTVNGNFVLLYNKIDSTVVDYFDALNF